MADNDVPLSPVKGVSKMDSHRSSIYTRRFISLGKTIPGRLSERRCNRRSANSPANSRCNFLPTAGRKGETKELNGIHNFTILYSTVTIFINASSQASS
ncbi:PREDICTED: uncharacterized protein LOC105619851 [Atta cephalotes]|uniref:Uncharacterized protein n=2 Tax=Atta TaxID=12956 RepID=A0A158NGV0_ATTCE|nr:PREDICTED: uncharacterized protein LOC105619851 [Atta cephalotes]